MNVISKTSWLNIANEIFYMNLQNIQRHWILKEALQKSTNYSEDAKK